MVPQVISFHCIMKNRLGQVLSSSFNRDVINQRDPENDRLPGLVDSLQSVKAGEKRVFTVPAIEAYGSYDPSLIIELRQSELDYDEHLAVGSQVLRRHGRSRQMRLFRVTRLEGDTVVMDGNHPLAGHDLEFEIEITEAREAREEDFEEQTIFSLGPTVH